MTHQITRVDTIHEGFSTFVIATIRLPDGREMRREIEDHGRAVAVLPYDPQNRTAMVVRQFRPPVFYTTGETELLEAPAGILDEDDPAECARREAMEEIGLRLRDLEAVGTVWTTPGISTERIALFLAPYAAEDRVAEGGGLADEHEDIAVIERPLADLAEAADAGRLTDMKLLLLVQTLRLRHPDLFA